jgi:hypothetical protein
LPPLPAAIVPHEINKPTKGLEVRVFVTQKPQQAAECSKPEPPQQARSSSRVQGKSNSRKENERAPGKNPKKTRNPATALVVPGPRPPKRSARQKPNLIERVN